MKVEWLKNDQNLIKNAFISGSPLYFRGSRGLFSASIQIDRHSESEILLDSNHSTRYKDITADFRHELKSGIQAVDDENLLVGHLTLKNHRPESVDILARFSSSAHPSFAQNMECVHLPLNNNGSMNHSALLCLGSNQLHPCNQKIGNRSNFIAHYWEPVLSSFDEKTTPAMLLIPLVDIYHPGIEQRIALFGTAERGWKIFNVCNQNGETSWNLQTRVKLEPGECVQLHAFMQIHNGKDGDVWKVFHRYAHKDPFQPPSWLKDVKCSYMDFMSPALPSGKRDKAYEADANYFREFTIGLATQHGYYPHWGDYMKYGRLNWTCMKGDINGPVHHSLEQMKQRIQLTREQGAKAGIYIHLTGFDSCSPLASEFEDCVRINAEGLPELFPWAGPDMEGKAWFMSINSEKWRNHLLEQTELILELLDPDAIVIDETFAGIGYDHRNTAFEPSSPYMVSWMKEMRKLVHSYGPDKAVLTSDCDLANFVMWADGEAGDHTYPSVTGNQEYLRSPNRYLSALGDKAWMPTAWLFQSQWEGQLELAGQAGSAMAFGNGWLEYTGLANLPNNIRARMLQDLKNLNYAREING